MGERGYQKHLVEICRDYMGFFREIGRTTYNIVAPGDYLGDIGGVVGLHIEHNSVAYGHRIGGAYAFQSEFTFDFALYGRASSMGFNQIGASCITYYGSLHSYECVNKYFLSKNQARRNVCRA